MAESQVSLHEASRRPLPQRAPQVGDVVAVLVVVVVVVRLDDVLVVVVVVVVDPGGPAMPTVAPLPMWIVLATKVPVRRARFTRIAASGAHTSAWTSECLENEIGPLPTNR